MRYAIIADIHANLAAFTAVLDDIEKRGGVAEILCLGDIVGYGPEPHKCIELLLHQRHTSIAGNHDWAATGRLDLSMFNMDAAAVCRWTAGQINHEDIDFLNELPLKIERDNFTMVHGSPKEPLWEYILSRDSARENFDCFTTPFCLVGHSHVPLIFRQSENGECFFGTFRSCINLHLDRNRLILNPGSVGQPRDFDPRASYAIFDTETQLIRLYRVDYDIGSTQAEMAKNGLPMRLVARLGQGW